MAMTDGDLTSGTGSQQDMWTRVDSEIRDWLKRESEGRFSTLPNSSMEGFQLVFEFGRLEGKRWVSPDELAYSVSIGGLFPTEDEALDYVERIRQEQDSIEGEARVAESDNTITPLLGPGHEQE